MSDRSRFLEESILKAKAEQEFFAADAAQVKCADPYQTTGAQGIGLAGAAYGTRLGFGADMAKSLRARSNLLHRAAMLEQKARGYRAIAALIPETGLSGDTERAIESFVAGLPL